MARFFYLKPARNEKDGVRFIYLRITVEGKSCELSTKRKWSVDRWNVHAGRANGSKEDAKTLNAYLDVLTAKVYQAKKKLIDTDKEISSDANVYKSQLLERIPDKDYFQKYGFDGQISKFTGQLIGYSLTTRFVKATTWKEGAVTGYFVPEKILSDIGQRNQRIAGGEPEPPGGWPSGNVLNEVTVIGQKPVN